MKNWKKSRTNRKHEEGSRNTNELNETGNIITAQNTGKKVKFYAKHSKEFVNFMTTISLLFQIESQGERQAARCVSNSRDTTQRKKLILVATPPVIDIILEND